MNKKIRIVVDAMGGDFSPVNDVLGAVEAAQKDNSIEVILVGIKDKIIEVLDSKNIDHNLVTIVHASEVISMSDSPASSVRTKQDSSIVVGCKMVRDGKADAFVSAGNTGAVATSATFNIGRIKGVERPTMGTYFPNEAGITTIFDVGAFVDSKPNHLLGYALMASIFVENIYGISNPTVALLTVGEEEEKGGKVIKETSELLRNSGLNFIGNIEGRDILKGKSNIIICDGFTGNIVLKFGESFPKFLKHLLVEYSKKGLIQKLKVLIAKGVIKDALKPLDYQEYGGVPLLGVNGACIIGHGSSTPYAIANMVKRAKDIVEKQVNQKIESRIISLNK